MSINLDAFSSYDPDGFPASFSALNAATMCNATKVAAIMLDAAADNLRATGDGITADTLVSHAAGVYRVAWVNDVNSFPFCDSVFALGDVPTLTELEHAISNLEIINQKCALIVEAALALRNF